MRKPDPVLRQSLAARLRSGPVTTGELARALGVTLQTVRRLLAELPADAVVAADPRGRVRHALRRPLRGVARDLPLFSVDDGGRASELPSLVPIAGEGTFLPLPASVWPIPDDSRDGWWEGLPYPICAMRPTGYLGRLLARAEHMALGVADDPDAWSDDDVLWVLSRRGVDTPGNLIVGAEAYDLWLRRKLANPQPLPRADQPEAYAQLAARAVASAGGGSRAAGEFPKFAALRDLSDAATPHVLVKFSGASGTAAERRWADLLVCEHLALEHVVALGGVAAVRSRVLEHGGRVFLETERFDRVGLHGRRPVCSLDIVEAAFIGSHESAWPAVTGRLQRSGLVDAVSAAAIERLWWFGRLVADADMHLGNLTLHAEGVLSLAPAYDMLPMAYAPLAGGEVPPRTFDPDLPQPSQRAVWQIACSAAVSF